MNFLFTHCVLIFWLLMAISYKHKNRLETYLESLPPSLEVSYYIQDENGKVLASHNSENQIPSASIIKIPILIELMNQVEAGTLRLDEKVLMLETDVVSGAGELQFQSIGTSYTLEFLAREMIRISDNVATNLLIEKVKMSSVQSWLAKNGYLLTQLNRKMMDFDAIAAGKQNYTSPKEISHMLAMLYRGEYLSDESTGLVLELLQDCADRSTIPSKLPTGIRVAHKTGTLDYVRGDAGIILREKPLILGIFVEGFENIDQAEEVIGKIAKIAYEIL